MRRLLASSVAWLGVSLAVLSVATASAAPTLTLTEDCIVPNGVRVALNGFPANTPFHGKLDSPDGTSNQANLITDAGGGFSIGPFQSGVAGVWTATITWSGPTLVKSLTVDCPRGRMVGKGTVTSAGGQTASYVYIVSCGSPANAFEVRFGAQRFRLTSTSSVSCSDDPAVTTPAAGFDTQTGSGTGTLTSGGPATIEWSFSDGGPGGANDRAQITIKNAANTVVFQGSAAPPGQFPGSTQTTGFNTAQPQA